MNQDANVPPMIPPPSALGLGAAAAGNPMPPTQTNGWSIASLVTGIVLFCLPLLGGALAVIFAVLGLRRAKTTFSGKGLSIAGLVVGLVSICVTAIGSIVFGSVFLAVIIGTRPVRVATSQFIRDVGAGNTAAAMSETDGNIGEGEIAGMTATLNAWGTVQDVTSHNIQINNNTANISGVAKFSTAGSKSFHGTLIKIGDRWKVRTLIFD